MNYKKKEELELEKNSKTISKQIAFAVELGVSVSEVDVEIEGEKTKAFIVINPLLDIDTLKQFVDSMIYKTSGEDTKSNE